MLVLLVVVLELPGLYRCTALEVLASRCDVQGCCTAEEAAGGDATADATAGGVTGVWVELESDVPVLVQFVTADPVCVTADPARVTAAAKEGVAGRAVAKDPARVTVEPADVTAEPDADTGPMTGNTL